MIRKCAYCEAVFGEKEPLEDKSETTGICPACYPGVMRNTREQLRKINKEPEKSTR